MGDNIPTNRRIAKNATFLYLRLLISIIVGLFTSRVVLSTLGIDDYGIYSVVGGIVATMGFLNASMAGATSRFITVALGQNDTDRLKRTFASSMIIHFGIAISVIIIAETVGLWFLNNKLVIPADRMHAANWVYQFSIISAAIGITQVPYNACIIAHERMEVYAYVEIINSMLRLLIVYLLSIGNYDKLILYGALLVAVSIIVLTIYRIYCHRKFQECSTHFNFNKEYIKPMLTYSGWNLYNHMCLTTHNNGLNILLNLFWGVALNAAASITTTVSGAISGLSTNISQAMRPQIIKSYARGDIPTMQSILCNSLTYTLLFMGAISIPLIFEMEYVTHLWLRDVPPFTVNFCRIVLIGNIFFFANNILSAAIQATGNIKWLCTISSSMYIICLPYIYILFKNQADPQWGYYIQLATFAIATCSTLCILKRQIPKLNIYKTIHCIFMSLLTLIFTTVATSIPYIFLEETFLRLTICCLTSIAIASLITYKFILSTQAKDDIKQYIYSKLKIKQNPQ